jgi:2-octaprenylphenol hydroxylase
MELKAQTPAFDVVIVGAGLAGLSLAASISDKGLRIAVLEANPHPPAQATDELDIASWDTRVSALTPASVTLLTEIGAWSSLMGRRICPYNRMQVWDADGTGSIVFQAQDEGLDALGYIVENRCTQAALLARVRQCAGVTQYTGVALTGITEESEHLSLALSNGQQLTTALLVGADGARSATRALAGFRVREWSYGQTAIVGTVELDRPHENTCYQAFLSTGPVALLPLAVPTLCSIVWSVDDDQVAALMDADDAAFCRALTTAIGGAERRVEAVSGRAQFPLRQCHAVDYTSRRIALIADAAHSFHPLAGQGINMGFADVSALAKEINAAAARGADVGAEIVLRRYQRQRKGENLTMMAAMEAFKRGFGSSHPVLRVARNRALSWVDRGAGVKSFFMRQALGVADSGR